MAVKSVSIRIEEEMLKKLAYVADYEGRSINSHILVLVRENIKAFEDVNGTIEEGISADLNVKPVKKSAKESNQ
ncbi:MAG: Arc family DNA-binding protein [Clostridiales bacterium]|nr:Arc family DNA-binding protein [Clostridiales bacterium]